MKAAERIAAIRVVAEYLAEKREAEVDMILLAAGASTTTSAYWNDSSIQERRDEAISFLSGLTDEMLVTLLELEHGEGAEIAPALRATSEATGDAEIAPAFPPINEATRGTALVDEEGPIFVVHGHGHAALHEAVRVLERGTAREVVVLHEQASSGQTVLEKFEQHASGVAYAVVLLTGDDEGGAVAGSDRRLRGRQNVIFELGFFFGKLGRDRVAVLVDENVEKPSDIDGLVYIALDSRGAWKHLLARELSSAKIEVDHARIP